MSEQHPYKRRPVLHWAALLCFILGGTALAFWQVMVHPDTPLPREWHPSLPLAVDDPLTALTSWKLGRALADEVACFAALSTGAEAQRKPGYVENAQCGIAPQVMLSGAAGAELAPVNTRCQTALRLAMWSRHGLQPAAQEIFGQSVARIEHFSSYSCRAMRTTSGTQARMSSHATADAIDISGFVLSDGTRLTLLDDWKGEPAKMAFLRQANSAACKWFRLTLGPEYNSLHTDHFHLQHSGFGLCR